MASSPPRKPHYLEAPQHFVVAVDGSDMSKGAFEFVYSLARKGDKVTVVHLFDPAKEIPAHEMRPTGIYDFYSTRCVARFPSGCWKVDVREKPPGTTTRQALLSYINQKDVEADMFLVGFVGRKGPKEDPSVLGSAADYSLRSAHITAAVVKDKSFRDPAVFLVGVDGSERAHSAACLAVRLARPTDSIHIVHMVEGSDGSSSSRYDSTAVESRYAEFCSKYPNSQFALIKRGSGLSVSDALVAYANDKDVDVVLVGVDGVGAHAHGKTVLGSNSDAVVRKAPCSVVCVQDAHGIYASSDADTRR